MTSSYLHSLKQTSDNPFRGTCIFCGKENLGVENLSEPCPGPKEEKKEEKADD